jgi:acyl-ACP thioesterase
MEIREDKFTVKTYHCQPDGSIKVASLMNFLQEAAAVHAEQLGFGMAKLNEIESYWVLSNIKIEFTEFPKWNDKITLKTWPSGHTRSIATRDFLGRAEDGREIFKAGSEWMILNRTTNRPRNLKKTGLDLIATGPQTVSANLKRLAPRETYERTQQLRVPYSSIDLNNHVNNTEYVRWTIDALKRQFQFTGPIRTLQATYFSEVFENDQLTILLNRDENGHYNILAQKENDKTNVYAAEICS